MSRETVVEFADSTAKERPERNRENPLGLPAEQVRGKSVKEWVKRRTRERG